jgi:hypothetical protein
MFRLTCDVSELRHDETYFIIAFYDGENSAELPRCFFCVHDSVLFLPFTRRWINAAVRLIIRDCHFCHFVHVMSD